MESWPVAVQGDHPTAGAVVDDVAPRAAAALAQTAAAVNAATHRIGAAGRTAWTEALADVVATLVYVAAEGVQFAAVADAPAEVVLAEVAHFPAAVTAQATGAVANRVALVCITALLKTPAVHLVTTVHVWHLYVAAEDYTGYKGRDAQHAHGRFAGILTTRIRAVYKSTAVFLWRRDILVFCLRPGDRRGHIWLVHLIARVVLHLI